MGLEETLILKAIEDGQINGTKNVSGEWQVQYAELLSLYLSLAQDYCKRQWQADPRRNDGKSQEPEIAHVTDNDEGRVGQERSEARRGADQAETGPSIPATTSTWQDDIRIDYRDKISASDSRPAFRPSRIRLIKPAMLLALGCIGALSSFYFFSQNQAPKEKANTSSPVLGSEKASIPVATLESRSGEEAMGKIASATANAIDHQSESAKNLSQAASPPPAVRKQDATASHSTAATQDQPNPVRKLVPVPETRPTTIKGWTVRNVVNGIATLEGAGGTWKAARGDTLPGKPLDRGD